MEGGIYVDFILDIIWYIPKCLFLLYLEKYFLMITPKNLPHWNGLNWLGPCVGNLLP